jgi:hypothetical protein
MFALIISIAIILIVALIGFSVYYNGVAFSNVTEKTYLSIVNNINRKI